MATLPSEDREALHALDLRLRTVLPEQYQECYEDLQPVSMGSAGLRYRGDGRVAWDEMWGSFCDLAMAGGPPHKSEDGGRIGGESLLELLNDYAPGEYSPS